MLFILGAKILTRLINKEELVRNIHGIKVLRNAPGISHLMYASDLLVMCRASTTETKNMINSFNTYCQWSGQQANLEKTSIMFSKSTSRQSIKEILSITCFKHIWLNAPYLINSFVFNRNKQKNLGS